MMARCRQRANPNEWRKHVHATSPPTHYSMNEDITSIFTH